MEKAGNLLPTLACLAAAAAHGSGKLFVAEMFAGKLKRRDHQMLAG